MSRCLTAATVFSALAFMLCAADGALALAIFEPDAEILDTPANRYTVARAEDG